MVLRLLKHKTGNDVMKLFEQLRKNINHNRSWDKKAGADKSRELKRLKKEFYDGLLEDMMKFKEFYLAEIVMAEKLKEKFVHEKDDELIELKVYSALKKFDQYKEKFDILLDKEGSHTFDSNLADQLGSTLMTFDTDQ
jgi:hypothetical protein